MSSSAARQRRLVGRTQLVREFCHKYGFEVVPLNHGYQLRIENVLDIYPVNARWCWLPTGERGEWQDADELRDIMLRRLEVKIPPVVMTGQFHKIQERSTLWQRVKRLKNKLLKKPGRR